MIAANKHVIFAFICTKESIKLAAEIFAVLGIEIPWNIVRWKLVAEVYEGIKYICVENECGANDLDLMICEALSFLFSLWRINV